MKTADKFWDRVDITDECWLWIGGTSGGRPVLYIAPGNQVLARRYSWELHRGVLPSGCLVVGCESLCVNPDHLSLLMKKRIGTQPIPDSKRCRDCDTTKQSNEFPLDAKKVDGLGAYCRSCVKRRHLRSNLAKYGLTIDGYETLLVSQGGVCAVCGESPTQGQGVRLHVDHDHETGRVRGLLCQGCNCALGQAKEDPIRLRKMAEYLERIKCV